MDVPRWTREVMRKPSCIRSGFHEPPGWVLGHAISVPRSGMSFRDFQRPERKPKIAERWHVAGGTGRRVECHSVEARQLCCPYAGTRAHSEVRPAGDKSLVPLVAIQKTVG